MRSKARARSTGTPAHSFPERAGQEQKGSSSFIHHVAGTGAWPLRVTRLLHTQYTQVSSMGTIKDIIKSSSVFFSLDHLAGPLEAHVPL